MDKQTEEILQKIEEAEYVLVGLGQEFDMEFFLQSREDYRRIREELQQQNVLWLLPYVEEQFRRQYLPEMEAEIEKGLQKLAKVLEKKSYFVVSSSLNHKLAEVPWKKMLLKKERFVAPCGELIHDIDADSLRNKLEYLRRRTIDVKSFKIWRGRLKHEGKDV